MADSGTLISIYGYGVLLQGKAGIGKSELALSLVDHGHRLVADDALGFFLDQTGRVTGAADAAFSGFIEVRGIGVINIARLYGPDAVQSSIQLDLILKMEEIDCHDYDRISGWHGIETVCGRPVPWRCLPVTKGRNLPLLAETLVRVEQLAGQGYDAGNDFVMKLKETMRKGAA